MRVLIADDERDFCQMLAEYLAPRGIEVVEASDGFETLRHVSRGGFDAVLLDLRMPRLGGIDALKRIRAFDPTLPVIVVTAAIEPELHRQSRALGARAVFQKPIALPELLATLQGSIPPGRALDAVVARADRSLPVPPPPAATRVLVVDDDAEMRETLVEALTRHGYATASAGDGPSAVRTLAQTPTDVVLLDIGLPGLSGIEALPTIRALAPRAAVIMVTANTDRGVARHALAHGAFDYLVKPVNLSYLRQSIERALMMEALVF